MVSSNKNGFNVTHKMVIGLSLPMTLAYLTTPILGLVDTAVVGRLGDAALIGGLAVGAIIIDFLFATFNFLRSGTTGLTAQALGADDKKEIQALLFRALTVSTVIGLIMIALLPIIVSVGLYYMNAGAAVSQAAKEYLNIRILGSPVNLANFVLLGWLIGMGKSGTGLLLQIVLNGTNIVLSILLGLTFGFGVAGVAWATVIAELVALAAGLYICWRLFGDEKRPSKARVFNRQAMWKFANLNVDIMIRSFALLFAFAFFTSVGAQFGELTLAANAVLMNFFMIAGYFLDGLATASEQIVGRAVGAKYKPAFNKGVTYTLLWNFILAVILALVFYIFGEQLVALITTLDSVQNEAQIYLWLVALLPITGVLAFQMDGVYIGATWSRLMSLTMLTSTATYLLAWYFLQPFGNYGLWISLHIFLITRGVTLTCFLPFKTRQAFKE